MLTRTLHAHAAYQTMLLHIEPALAFVTMEGVKRNQAMSWHAVKQ